MSAHVVGVNFDEWNKEAKKFEELVKKISELSNKKSYTEISADHGLTNIPKENRFHLAHQEGITYMEIKDLYMLMALKKIIEVKYSGTINESNRTKSFTSTPDNEFVMSLYPIFCFSVEDKNIIYPSHLKTELAGYHGGLSSEEIKIPIIEISNF